MSFTSETEAAEQAVWQWLDQRFSLTDVETEELQRLLDRLQEAANPQAHLAPLQAGDWGNQGIDPNYR